MAVLPLAEQTKDTTNLMLLYNNLVAYYKKSNRKAQAFEYEKKCLEYEGKCPVMQVASSLSMAGLLTSMNNLSLAEEYIENAEKLLRNKDDRRTIAQISYYKARLEFARKNYNEAIKYIDLAYSYFVDKEYTNQIVAALSDKALFAKHNKDLSLYEDCINKLEGYIGEVKSITYKYAATRPVAKYYIDKNNSAKAKLLMDNLDVSLDNIDWNNRDEFLELKASIAKSERNYLQSIGCLEQLNVYQDSMRNANVSNQIILSEQLYDREKKKQEINQLNVKADVAQANLNT